MALNTLPSGCTSALNCLILPSAARVATAAGVNNGSGVTSTTATWTGVDSYTSADVFVKCTAASGTSPTLIVYIQKLSADGSTWQDVATSSQITSATNSNLTAISASMAGFAPTDGTLAAATLKLAQMGHTWRIKYVIAGTNPSFTFAVYGDFYK